MKSFVLLGVMIMLGSVFSSPSNLMNLDLNEDWILFKNQFNKTYKNGDEELLRRSIWEDNLKYIQKHNLEYDLGKHNFTTGINEFSDLSFEEFKSLYLPRQFSSQKDENGQSYLPPLNVKEDQASIDWRTQGYVTGVKNQGQCGSCWAFSTTGSLEGQHFRKYQSLISLSEQQLIDCSSAYGNNGCNGGLMSNAVDYIKAVGGIESEFSYPYNAQQLSCKFNKEFAETTAMGYVNIPVSEVILANAVLHIGPISVGIDASHPSFQHYRSGVYYEPTCSSNQIDHAVLIVGYGKDNYNTPYWIVKNSWGNSWGLDGYIYMSKDRNNNCAIAALAGYPLV